MNPDSNATIAYLGIPGSFSHAAAINHFGAGNSLVNFRDFKGVFGAVAGGSCKHGLVPLENSLAGSIYENYDLLRNSTLSITGEVLLKIEHHLCVYSATPDGDLSSLSRVYSHPKALEQVGRFLCDHPHLEAVASTDTASAAQFVYQEKNIAYGAICGENAAEIYGLKIIRRNLEDDPLNYTRFAIISSQTSTDSLENKCSLQLILPHIPKSLFKALEIIVSVALNTSKIESRPIPGKPFEYVFYIDFEFEPADRPNVDTMLEKLRQAVTEIKILGFYRRSTVFS